MKKSISIRQIAELAGVSTATVSRVFSGTGYVNEETRQQILDIAAEHDYKPKAYRHRVVNTNNPLVGVIVADLQNVFFRVFYDRLSSVLSEHHVNVVLCNTAESAQKEIQCLDMLRQLHVNGIIITPVSEITAYNAEFMREMKNDGIPVILFDRDIKGASFDGVFQDNFGGALQAVEALIAEGHTHIATIAGPLSSKPGLDRLNGYLEAMKTHGLQIRQEYICYGDFKMGSGYESAKMLLTKYPRITALFCANNMMAVGALRAIRDEGLSVPDDIAVLSYGSLVPFELYNDSPISAIVQPAEMMGEECGMMILQELNNSVRRRNHPARRITLETTLKIRGSQVFPQNRLNEKEHG